MVTILERAIVPLLLGSGVKQQQQQATAAQQGGSAAAAAGATSGNAAPAALATRLTQLLRRLVMAFCRFLLSAFPSFQDSLLAVGPFRALVVWAMAPVVTDALLQAAVLPPSALPDTFDTSPYFVSGDSRQLLVHAASHALAWQPDASHARYTARLPAVGRILLQAPGAGPGAKFQEAVASALAKEVGWQGGGCAAAARFLGCWQAAVG